MRIATRVTTILLAGLSAAVTFAGPAAAAEQPVNDYRWRGDTVQRADSWGFTTRQCVSFTAWRLAQRGKGVSTAMGYRNASNWDDVARQRGVRISSTPRTGAIAQWNAYEKSPYWYNGQAGGWMQAGGYGHVGYVSGVYGDGSVRLEQYNMNGERSYSMVRVKAPRYLYLS